MAWSDLRQSLQDLSKEQVIELLKGLYDLSPQNKAWLRGKLLPVGQDSAYLEECRRKVVKAVYDPARKTPGIPRFRDAKRIITDYRKFTRDLRGTLDLMVLLDTGVRLSELIHIQLSDLDIEQGRIKVFGKGVKECYVYLGKAARRALWRYISLARPKPALESDDLFLCEDGHPITDRYLAHILEKVSKAAGVKKVHPHRFRRTAAIQFLRNGGNIFALQKMLGHETLDMVRHYVNLVSDDVAIAHQQASPVDGWRL